MIHFALTLVAFYVVALSTLIAFGVIFAGLVCLMVREPKVRPTERETYEGFVKRIGLTFLATQKRG